MTLPSVSVADAWMVTLAGAAKTAPFTGLVMVTEGGLLAAAWTVTVPVMPKAAWLSRMHM